MKPPMGFVLEDDECDCPEPEQDNVGSGCADLTPVTDEEKFLDVALALREKGAKYVKFGENEVAFAVSAPRKRRKKATKKGEG